MASQGRHVKADITQQIVGSGFIAGQFCCRQNRLNVAQSLVVQHLLLNMFRTHDVSGIVLPKVALLQLGVEVFEAVTYPSVKLLDRVDWH